jgi:hypothetical protein
MMQLGFVMHADAARHDDRRLWPDVVDHHRGRRPLRKHLSPLTLTTSLVGQVFRVGQVFGDVPGQRGSGRGEANAAKSLTLYT